MDFLGNKALMISVGISITLVIASAILFTMNQITLLYQDVYTTDISISNQFMEYSAYDQTVMFGIEMYNTAKKYKDNPAVIVKCNVGGERAINNSAWINSFNGSDRNVTSRSYNVTYTTDTKGIVTIFFRGR